MKSITKDIEGRSFARSVEHLRSVVICGVTVPIVRGTLEACPELRDGDEIHFAVFDYERVAVIVRAGQAPSVERDSLVHELCHAFLFLSGLSHAMRTATKMAPEKFEEVEEAWVRSATPHLVSLITAGASWL